MIFLRKLYSESKLFEPVEFKNGINVVLGRYSSGSDSKEINGIGKSTFVRLIDYCLASEGSKRYFDVKKKTFLKGHSCTLVVEINGTDYLIQRFFDKASITFAEIGGAVDPVEYTDKEFRNVLGAKFFAQDPYGGVIESNWYRTLLNFFIKDDVDRHERNDPLNFLNPSIRNSLLLVYNFFLLNLPNGNIYDFDKHSEKARDLRETKTSIEKQSVELSGKRLEDLESERSQIEKKIKLIEKSLKEFQFIDNYKDIQNKLVELSVAISTNLQESSSLRRRLQAIESSYAIDISVDIEKVKSIYESLKQGLGEAIVRPVKDVITFRKEIAENRRTFLTTKEREIKDAIGVVNKKIIELESRRITLYKTLDEKEAMDSIRNSYEELIEYRSQLQQNLAVTGKIAQLNEAIADLDLQISGDVKNLVAQQLVFADKVEELQGIFTDFVHTVVGQSQSIGSAYFDIKTRPDKRSPVQVTIEVPKSASLGKSRFKILAYDLTVFFNLIDDQRALPHFLLHDGAFHGIDIKTTINVLNYIAKRSEGRRFQYIFTANEHEIDSSSHEGSYGQLSFNLKDATILVLEDKPEKMFLKREFQS